MKYLSRLLITVLMATALAASSIAPTRGAEISAPATLAGTWVVHSTCLPRCYADPKLRHNMSTATVVLRLERQDKTLFYVSPTTSRFADTSLSLLPLGDRIIALHTSRCSMQLHVESGLLRMSGSGIKVSGTATHPFVSKLSTVWTRTVSAPPGPPSSIGLTTYSRSDTHLPVGC